MRDAARVAGVQLPSIAVIIPCWNAREWIATAVNSVLDQNYPRMEILVVDDGSTDGSLDVVRSFGDKVRRLVLPNGGACAARNRGVRETNSDFVLFLDADDFLLGDFLLGLGKVAGSESVDLVVGKLAGERDGTLQDIGPHLGDRGHAAAVAVLTSGLFQTGQALWSRRFLVSIGLWDETLLAAQDTEIGFRAAAAATGRVRFACSTEGRTVWRLHHGQNRVSQQADQRSLASRLQAYDLIRSHLGEGADAHVRSRFAIEAYRLAARAYRSGFEAVGDGAFEVYRQMGGRRHVGNWSHRLIASLVGLRAKEALARTVRGARATAGSRR